MAPRFGPCDPLTVAGPCRDLAVERDRGLQSDVGKPRRDVLREVGDEGRARSFQ